MKEGRERFFKEGDGKSLMNYDKKKKDINLRRVNKKKKRINT
jgi:hypothetical protein